MSQNEYYVDLEALDTVGRKLNGVLRAMQQTRGEAARSTMLPDGALGSGFQEEQELRGRHDELKGMFEEQILQKLEELISDLSQKTNRTRGAYEDREYDASNALNPGT